MDMQKKLRPGQALIFLCVMAGLIILSACFRQGAPTPTPTLDITPTPTLADVVYEPTSPIGYSLPITLSNVVLQCTAQDSWLMEFDYLPVLTHFDIVDDPLNPKTNLTCAYRTPGHGTCAGFIDFSASSVVSIRLCQGSDPASWICISQSLYPAQCPVQSVP
jgi:hypothetical protein